MFYVAILGAVANFILTIITLSKFNFVIGVTCSLAAVVHYMDELPPPPEDEV